MLYLQNLKQRVERPPEDMGIPVKWALNLKQRVESRDLGRPGQGTLHRFESKTKS